MTDPISKTTFGPCERVGDMLVCDDLVIDLGNIAKLYESFTVRQLMEKVCVERLSAAKTTFSLFNDNVVKDVCSALGAVLFPENETVDPSIKISPDEIMRF